MVIKNISYPRAALIGNPSDGFYGKTIAFPFNNFHVEAKLIEREGILMRQASDEIFESINSFYAHYVSQGNQNPKHILYATVKKFLDYCKAEKIILHDRGFEIEFDTTIPREVGLAGSSAIITAVLRNLLEFYNVTIPIVQQANLILEVETQEMGISAGLQDRVVLAYGRPIYMNFNKQLMDSRGYGDYQAIQATLFESIFIAYRIEEAEGSEVVHNDLRARFDNGDEMVHSVMLALSGLTDDFLSALKQGAAAAKLGEYINKNFNLRQSICHISKNNLEMINLARSVGASAKFTGSGGAIIGNYSSNKMYNELENVFKNKGIQIFKPTIVDSRT